MFLNISHTHTHNHAVISKLKAINGGNSVRATNLEKMFLQGSGYAKVPNSVMTTRFSVMALT